MLSDHASSGRLFIVLVSTLTSCCSNLSCGTKTIVQSRYELAKGHVTASLSSPDGLAVVFSGYSRSDDYGPVLG